VNCRGRGTVCVRDCDGQTQSQGRKPGKTQNIDIPISAWTADWRDLSHNHEVRWPYVFVAALEDGLQVFNMMDPTNPYTVGFYDTYDGPDGKGLPSPMQGDIFNGAWGVDVRLSSYIERHFGGREFGFQSSRGGRLT